MVLEFLKNYYGVDNIRIRKFVVCFVFELEDSDIVSKCSFFIYFSVIGLSLIDVSMCLIFYVVIVVVVIVLYVYFI